MMSKKWHVNPFNPRKVIVHNMDSGASKEVNAPMTWEDAARWAFIIMISEVFIAFLTLYTWANIIADPGDFCYRLFVFAGGTFFVQFGLISGISRRYAGQSTA